MVQKIRALKHQQVVGETFPYGLPEVNSPSVLSKVPHLCLDASAGDRFAPPAPVSGDLRTKKGQRSVARSTQSART